MEEVAKEKKSGIEGLSIDDIVQRGGLPVSQARTFFKMLQKILERGPPHLSTVTTWQCISQELLTPAHPHTLHALIFNSVYADWDPALMGPPIAWLPTPDLAHQTNLGRMMEARGRELMGPIYTTPIESFPAFQKFSARHPELYWSIVLEELSLKFHVPPRCIFDKSQHVQGTWLPGAIVNAAESALMPYPKRGKMDGDTAIIWRNEGQDDMPVQSLTIAELRRKVSLVANSLETLAGFQKGDRIAIDMPMNTSSIIIYLAIVLVGYVVVSIADSFVPSEIATRLRISKAKAIFTQDHIYRGGKEIPLYSRVVEAKSPLAIVLPGDGVAVNVVLREQDMSWESFLSLSNSLIRPWEYQPTKTPIEAFTNILFSSGTTGEPKAVPWTHLHPIRVAAEAWAHMDMRKGDVLVWPTNLGWMMGPFVIYTCLLNGATIGVYNGSPLDCGFGKFVQDAGATILGTVPSMVKTWRKKNCMDGLDWSRIRFFASTGEASNPDDDLWLSSRAYYKPVIEACGGTELAGAFVHGCLLQPQAFATFSTPTLATNILILDDEGRPYPEDQVCMGELVLTPMLGSSDRLLNADHDAIYYKGMPMHNGVKLRRHGDIFERMIGGYYKAHGRCDDTMNLGGIKTSSVEIERVCDKVDENIVETAATGVPSPGGGPEQLVVFVVLREGTVVGQDNLQACMSKALQKHLNPLFKVSFVIVLSEFPRTATNKVMRRVLKAQFLEGKLPMSRL